MQQLCTGLLLGVALTLLMGSYNQDQTARAVDNLTRELSRTNGELQYMRRSLERMSQPFGSTELRVRSNK